MSRKALLFLVAIVLVALPVAAKNANVKIVNKTEWTLHHFFLSSTENEEWGPDQLGEEVIETNGSFTLTDVPCDSYDVKLVDEAGDECVVTEVDICGGAEQWVITSKDLAQCEGYEE